MDIDFLTKAFNGADGVFILIPPNAQPADFLAYQTQIAEAEVKAIRNAKVKQVVFLSSVGAHLSEKNGVVQGLYVAENMLNELEGVHVVHLRAASFMENFLGSIPMIQSAGINGSPLHSDLLVPVIATQDIAAAAVEQLEAHGGSDKVVQYLLGERDLTMPEATAILGQAIGKPGLPYIPFSIEDTKKAFLGYGMGESFVDAMMEFQQSVNDGLILNGYTRTPQNTTPTSIEQFAATFAAIYNA